MRLRWRLGRGLSALLFLASPAGMRRLEAQQVIDHTEARKHTNQRAIVEGPVAQVRRQSNGDVWLCLGKPYPSSTLVVIIPTELARSMQDVQAYQGKRVRVRGQIQPSSLEGPPPMTSSSPTGIGGGRPSKPSIVLEDSGQIEIVPGP